MKRTMILLALSLMITAGLCCSAQAITQEELEGVWAMEMKPYFVSQGVPQEQVDTLMALIGDVAVTYEFTADGILVTETTRNGQTEREAVDYVLLGDIVVLGGTKVANVTREGHTLKMTNADGMAYILHAQGTAVPAAGNELVGVWVVSHENVLELLGITEEDYETVEAYYGEIRITMEFKENGEIAVVMMIAGQTETNTLDYEVHGNALIIDGMEGSYSLNGDQLTINDPWGATLYLNQSTAAAQTADPAVLNVPAEAPITEETPVIYAQGNDLVGIWALNHEDMLKMHKITEEEYEVIKGYYGEMSMIVEFKPNGEMTTTLTSAGQTEMASQFYEVSGNVLTIDGMSGSYSLNGDQVSITNPSGITMNFTRQ